MKKKTLLIISILLFTGCTVNYDLEIVNEDYKENIAISSYTKLTNEDLSWEIPIYKDESKVSSIKSNNKIEGVTYYEKFEKVVDNLYKYEYKHDFKMKDYYRSYFTNSAVDFIGVFYEDADDDNNKLITISTGLKFNVFEYYPDTEKVIVNIKTNHKVKEHNADSKDKYTYTWSFEKDTKDKAIQLLLYKDKYVLNYNNVFVKTMILIAVIIVFIIVLFSYLYNNSKKNNKL